MSDNTMPVDWIPRLCKDPSYRVMPKHVVFLPLRIYNELRARPQLAIRQSPYFERCERGMSLAGNISGVYWRNWTTTRNPDGTHAGDIVYGTLSYYDDHAQAVASQRQLCALMLEYWRREQ